MGPHRDVAILASQDLADFHDESFALLRILSPSVLRGLTLREFYCRDAAFSSGYLFELLFTSFGWLLAHTSPLPLAWDRGNLQLTSGVETSDEWVREGSLAGHSCFDDLILGDGLTPL